MVAVEQKANVPALRFPEFSGDWEILKFGEVIKIGNGQVDPKVEPFASMPHVSPDRVSGGTGDLQGVQSAKEDGIISGKYLFDEEALVYSKIRPNLNKVAMPGYGGLCSADMYPIWPIEGKAEIRFLVQLMRDARFVEAATAVSMRTGLPKINRPDLTALKVIVPSSLPEQKKIAAFLGVVDAKIAALRARRAGLERYKKGMMQALFSQRLRFTKPDGTPFPDWQEKRLGDLCDSLSGHPVAGHDILEKRTNTPLLRGMNITEGEIRHSDEMDRYHGGDLTDLSRFFVQDGDVVVSMDGSKVGKNVATVKENDAGSFLIQRVTRLRGDGKNDLRLIYQHITSKRFRKYVDIVNTSSGIPHISLKQIRDFIIPTPHPDEQQKIAEALQALDAKIAAIGEQITKMEAFKKGLLQQMFV